MSSFNKLAFPWVVAIVATLGSLYFSEVRGFIPCTMCWYQRILMYPLVILFGVAYFKRDYKIIQYSLPLTAIGMFVSFYHYGLQKFGWEVHNSCEVGIPCSGVYANYLGFITIPFLAFTAFTLITTYSLLLLRKFR